MSDSDYVYRVHPAIGFARVGNSQAYFLGSETLPGLPVADGSAQTGGLPIRPGTESETITSNDLRDRNGALKRQAARFKIYQYPKEQAASYPCCCGEEIQVGSVVDGKQVTNIIWTVHLANKKANAYIFNSDLGEAVYQKVNADKLQVRNVSEGEDLNNAARLKKLVIDPGPRAIRGTDETQVCFDKTTPASFWNGGMEIKQRNDYPKSFPDNSFTPLYTPVGKIESLGELETDKQGRLIVTGGYGKACAWYQADGKPYPLLQGVIAPGVVGNVNENGWFDDTSDGPVSAVLVFDDDSVHTAHDAWVVVADPSFAPQIANVVSLWDDIYDSWVRKLDLCPQIFRHKFQDHYQPYFEQDLSLLFSSVSLQRWTTNLPQRAIEAHDAVRNIAASDDPDETILTGLAFIRDPNNATQSSSGAPFMPLAGGDIGKSFLTVTLTQYFFLTQWNRGQFRKDSVSQLGPGELLDKSVMANCMGGGFAPGLEMTFVVRNPSLYQENWRETGAGPFRIRARQFDYNAAQSNQPLLTAGYVPLHPGPDGLLPAALEPGDTSKFMALPWHTDFNACATHNAEPNPSNSTTLYWAWPAQRPVQIYRAEDVVDGQLGPQQYSVRGNGTYTNDLGKAGRYQQLLDIVRNWHHIGVVMQGSAIDGGIRYSPLQYLEVESQLDEVEIKPWPMNSNKSGE